MRALLILIAVFACYFAGFAQNRNYVTIGSGNNIMDILSQQEVFMYPSFTDGKVFMKDGSEIKAKMNYSRVSDEIHFISEKGDTLALGNEKLVKFIVAGVDTIFYDEGYLKQLNGGKDVKLAIKDYWIITSAKKLGAYNTSNNSVRVDTYSLYTREGKLYNLIVNEDVEIKRAQLFYFGDGNNHFMPASKKNLFALFPKNELLIETYLKEQKIDFRKKSDVDRLFSFLQEKL
jgi:hypothetical protein